MTRPFEKAYFVVAVAIGLGCASQTARSMPEAVWYWSSDCPKSKTMGLELLLNGKSIYHSAFAVCRIQRTEVPARRPGHTLAFSVKGGHTFQDRYRTTPRETIEVNIWQAGVESDGLLLGVSFSTKDQGLLNTVHFAKPDRVSESTLDPGLLIRTYPVCARVSNHRS